MSLKRYYYEPEDPNAEPISYEFDGGVCVFESPHQYHKMVEENYEVGLIIDERTQLPKRGRDGEPLKLKNRRFKWEPDEEKNDLLKRGKLKAPKNWRDLSDSELRHLKTSRYAEIFPQLTSDEDRRVRHEVERERLRLEHLAEIERLKAELEAERAHTVREIEAEKRKRPGTPKG